MDGSSQDGQGLPPDGFPYISDCTRPPAGTEIPKKRPAEDIEPTATNGVGRRVRHKSPPALPSGVDTEPSQQAPVDTDKEVEQNTLSFVPVAAAGRRPRAEAEIAMEMVKALTREQFCHMKQVGSAIACFKGGLWELRWADVQAMHWTVDIGSEVAEGAVEEMAEEVLSSATGQGQPVAELPEVPAKPPSAHLASPPELLKKPQNAVLTNTDQTQPTGPGSSARPKVPSKEQVQPTTTKGSSSKELTEEPPRQQPQPTGPASITMRSDNADPSKLPKDPLSLPPVSKEQAQPSTIGPHPPQQALASKEQVPFSGTKGSGPGELTEEPPHQQAQPTVPASIAMRSKNANPSKLPEDPLSLPPASKEQAQPSTNGPHPLQQALQPTATKGPTSQGPHGQPTGQGSLTAQGDHPSPPKLAEEPPSAAQQPKGPITIWQHQQPATLSTAAIDRRLRRCMAPTISGAYKVSEKIREQWENLGTRPQVLKMFAQCGFDSDWVNKNLHSAMNTN